MNVISPRTGTAQPEEMLCNARMTGVGKLRCSAGHLGESPVWAVIVERPKTLDFNGFAL